MSTVNEIIEKLKTLTLLEASELVSQIEETFGVDASAPVGGGVMMAAMPAGGAAEAAPKEEEKTLFDVVLEEIPADKKVGVYKVVRNIANIAVNQVKDFTATLPKTLKESVSKEEAEAAKQQLEEVGALLSPQTTISRHHLRDRVSARIGLPCPEHPLHLVCSTVSSSYGKRREQSPPGVH